MVRPLSHSSFLRVSSHWQSFHEKQRLSQQLHNLSGEHLSVVVNMFETKRETLEGEVEIDIDAQSTATLRRVEAYVRDVRGAAYDA